MSFLEVKTMLPVRSFCMFQLVRDFQTEPDLWFGLNVNIQIVLDDFYWAFTLSKSRNEYAYVLEKHYSFQVKSALVM